MARYTDAVCKLCRREGVKLFLKGERCLSEKCPLEKRPFPPGEHGRKMQRETSYGVQLREKQKAKRIYGVLENQFRKYYEKAAKQKGKTGENLLRMLETRFDNVIFRMGFAFSRREARQLITHRHFKINDRTVNIPSYSLKPGDSISLSERGKKCARIKECIESANKPALPAWLEVNYETMTGKVIALPQRGDIDFMIKEQLIVELYSK